ncbi:unnamed protein product [Gongylonema pulchrum]|uniref:Transposase n=1 Tax=Gongylonema pulchrum TaxID=637853 RepID=A0A183DXI1_9BILA|nr:unnamed protein product [Gongylonema pulchrum]
MSLDVSTGSLNLALDGAVIADRRDGAVTADRRDGEVIADRKDGHFPTATSVASGRHSYANQRCCFGIRFGLLAGEPMRAFSFVDQRCNCEKSFSIYRSTVGNVCVDLG